MCGAFAYTKWFVEDDFIDDFEDDLTIRKEIDERVEESKTIHKPKPRSRGRRYADKQSSKKPSCPPCHRWPFVFIFGVGYWGTSFTLKVLNKKSCPPEKLFKISKSFLSQHRTNTGRKVPFPLYSHERRCGAKGHCRSFQPYGR